MTRRNVFDAIKAIGLILLLAALGIFGAPLAGK